MPFSILLTWPFCGWRLSSALTPLKVWALSPTDWPEVTFLVCDCAGRAGQGRAVPTAASLAAGWETNTNTLTWKHHCLETSSSVSQNSAIIFNINIIWIMNIEQPTFGCNLMWIRNESENNFINLQRNESETKVSNMLFLTGDTIVYRDTILSRTKSDLQPGQHLVV